jgi:hypothetical protein
MSSFFSSITGGGKDNGGDKNNVNLASTSESVGLSSSSTVQQVKQTIHDEASIGQVRLLMDVRTLSWIVIECLLTENRDSTQLVLIHVYQNQAPP